MIVLKRPKHTEGSENLTDNAGIIEIIVTHRVSYHFMTVFFKQ